MTSHRIPLLPGLVSDEVLPGTGPKGPTGDQGPEGPQGPIGPSGSGEMTEPVGYEERIPLRQFTNYCVYILDNLAANPSERTHRTWTPVELHMLLTNLAIPANIAEWDANKVKADALSPPMRCIPGYRVMPPATTRASWFSLSYWTTLAASLVSFLAARRAADDPTIELDIEGYGDGYEPTDEGGVGHPAETYAAFVIASQPMFDALDAM